MIYLCELSDIPDPGSKGFPEHKIFAVRFGQAIYLYTDLCPHRDISLSWQPDQFLDESQKLIECANHGALFLPKTGECITGPCQGASLQSRKVEVKAGKIYLLS